MPKLPTGGLSRDSQLLEKDNWGRGEITQKPAWVPKIPTRRAWNLHLKLIFIALLAIIVLALIYVGATRYLPGILDKAGLSQSAQKFGYPVNAGEIDFPSENVKDKFLENMRLAEVERDAGAKYKLFEENYILLKGFYSTNSQQKTRVQLESFREYIKKNYPDKFQASQALYEIPCLDGECPKVTYPDEISAIRDGVTKSSSLDAQVKSAVLKNFDAAAQSAGDAQVNYYLSAFSLLSSVSKQNSSGDVRNLAIKMQDYITKNYPEILIPDDLKL